MPALDDPALRTVLASVPDLELALVFGSCARGQAGPESDLDLAIATATPLTAHRRQDLADRLAVLGGRPVDLVDLATAGGPLLASILRHGRVIAQPNPATLGRLYVRLLDWQADLRPAVDALLASRRRRLLSPRHG